MPKILITGSSGLVGSALADSLECSKNTIRRFDLREKGIFSGDVQNREQLSAAIHSVDGVIHLAAVSRVIAGEQNPQLCHAVNVGGLKNLLEVVEESPLRPWIVFASSREVYGQAERLPVSEDAPLIPMNTYARSKVEGERLVLEAQKNGIRACTIRLSNVFGSPDDHSDRVVPAFARAAALGNELRIDGPTHTFDFTHIDDVTRGITCLIDLLLAGSELPLPIHFVSGNPTTLDELAHASIRIAGSRSSVRYAPPRHFDVSRFWGNPARAKSLLGWESHITLEEGLSRLIRAFRSR